jgi:hypothetical protein
LVQHYSIIAQADVWAKALDKRDDDLLKDLKFDGFVKSPTAALRFIFRHCGVLVSMPHSSRFASLAFGAFYFAVQVLTFYQFIKFRLKIITIFLYGSRSS